ncbi:MAG: hypothetical protein JWO30_4128 [Fibrobacteres bacterium]|nr:hypothetical protein [Fibrobacterota bacterium]
MRARPIILVVDKSIALLKTYEQLFSSLEELKSFDLVTRPSAEAALGFLSGKRAGEKKPAVIILGIHVQDLDALTFLDIIKSDFRWRNIPVIISAGSKSNAQIALVRSRQACDFLLKPLQTRAVVGIIERALRPRSAGWG